MKITIMIEGGGKLPVNSIEQVSFEIGDNTFNIFEGENDSLWVESIKCGCRKRLTATSCDVPMGVTVSVVD